MFNEFIFIFQSLLIAIATLTALRLGSYALIAFICLQGVLSNLFVIKQLDLFGFHVTSSDAYSVGMILGLNLLQEFYGPIITRKTIWLNFFCLIFYTIVSQIHLLYTPNVFDTMQPHFAVLLSLMPRITIASFAVYLFVQLWDAWFYGVLNRLSSGRYFIGRTYLAASISQLLDTVLFSFLGLYGIIEDVWNVIMVSYTVKMAVILIATPLLMVARKLYKST